MYNAYFGFREKPFNVTPDPRFFYATPVYEEVYANLLYGILERKGFVVLTGEVGTGKTTLLRRLMDNLGDSARFVFFYNTTLTFEELLDFTCQELGLEVKTGGRLQKIQVLNQFLIRQLEQGGTVALLIDEAQNLSEEVLENLRLLSNLETAREKLLQIVLVGQPEFEAKLAQPTLRQLKQRIATRCRLSRLKDREVGPFIDCRLRVAGYEGPGLFTPEAVQRLTFYAQGVPRLINIICDSALLIAYGASQTRVSAEIIEEVARDLQLSSVSKKTPPVELIGERVSNLFSHDIPLKEQAPAVRQTTQDREPAPTTAIQTEKVRAAPASHPRQKRLAWAGLLALLLGSGVTVYAPHTRDRLADLSARAQELFSIATMRVAGLAHDLNGRLAAFMSEKTDPEKIQPPHLEGELLTLTQESEPAPSPDLNESPPTVTQEAALPRDDSHHLLAAEEKEARETKKEAPSERPRALSPLLPENAWKDRLIVIQPGATISGTVFKAYGNYNTLVLDLIKEFNPHIADLDRVAAGETLWLPPLTLDTLLRQQTDNSYRLTLAAFRAATRAERFAQIVRRRGYAVEITPRRVSDSLLLYRVEIEGLKNLEEASQARHLVNISNVLFDASVLTGGPAVTDSTASQAVPSNLWR
ncbi:MAG: AAA family ATPase [Deltaproteobacteria bacterium]|nr:AAA family ATPase [Deltaproteobacteria bacterium]